MTQPTPVRRRPQISDKTRRADGGRVDERVKRLRSALQTIRNALHAHNRPDTPLPNSQRIRLRDIADLALEETDV